MKKIICSHLKFLGHHFLTKTLKSIPFVFLLILLYSCAQKQNTGRVADTILFFAKSIYNSNIFKFPISRQDIADLTGITRESTSRILSELNAEKIIEMHGRQISILNEKRLQDLSEKG